MKVTIKLFAVLCICAMVFVSCKPEPEPDPEPETGLEGQFMPGKKISSIESFNVINEDSLQPYMTKTFEWNGELFYKYTETTGGAVSDIQTFEYDSLNRVVKIAEEYLGHHLTQNFIYEEKQLVRVNRFENEELIEMYEFSRTDGKVTEVVHTQYNEETPEVTSNVLTWDGDNIVQVALHNTNGAVVPTNYTYDDKVNPFQGWFYSRMYYGLETIYSAHNVLTTLMETSAAGMTLTTTITHDYEYDADGYPTKENFNHSTTGGPIPISTNRVSFYTYLQ